MSKKIKLTILGEEYQLPISALVLKVSILPSRSQVITLTISRVSDMILPMS